MTQQEQRKRTTIRQGAVDDVMSQLSKLPEREKDPTKPVSLPELFRTKEYVVEIERVLRRGYSFDDLAEIFTERCGVEISARQLKYHHTHTKNLKAKGKKSKTAGASKKMPSPAKVPECDEKSGSNIAETSVEISPQNRTSAPQSTAFVSEKMGTTASEAGAFSTDRHRQHVEGD